jgi:YegS/Rv2252/BmrU family lipid kinase
MKKAVLYYNPRAGRTPLTRERLKLLLKRLYQLGMDAEAVTSDTAEGAVANLDLTGKDLLLIFGGDGTLHSLLPAVVKWNVPVGVLPSGTANVLARELGIPRNVEKAVEVLHTGKPRRICLGRSQDRFFHLMAGVGLDGYIIGQTSPRLKKIMGVGAYWLAGWRHFWNAPLSRFDVDIDGVVHQASFAVISNCRYYGGHLSITPRASLFENCLDVCLFTSINRSRFLTYLYGVSRGTHLSFSDVVYSKASSVRIEGAPGIPVQMDGELSGHLPLEVTTYSPGIEVIVPQ